MIDRKQIQNWGILTTAILFSLATGFGFSPLAIYKLMLQPILAIVSKSVLSGILSILLSTVVLAWAAMYFPNVKTLFSPRKTAEEESRINLKSALDETIALLKAAPQYGAFPQEINDKDIESYLNSKLKPQLNRQKMTLTNQIDEYTEHKNTLLTGLYYYLDIMSPISSLSDHWNQQKKKRLDSIILLLANIPQDVPALTEDQLLFMDKYSAYYIETIEHKLPDIVPGKLKPYLKKLPFYTVDALTYLNAFFVNSVGLMIFGGFPLIEILGVQSLIATYSILGFFAIVGCIGSLSLSRQSTLSAMKSVFGYSEKARKAMDIPAVKRENHGYFQLPLYMQTTLTLGFMATGIAISNFIANAALGEVLFAGKNIFELQNIIPALIANPLSAGYYSLLFGSMAALCTFVVVSAVLLSVPLTVQIKKEDKRGNPSILSSLKSLVYSGIAVLSITAGTTFWMGKSMLPMFLTNTQPISMAILLVFAAHTNYRYCYSKDGTILSNFVISTAVATGAATALYMNLQPSSIFNVMFGPQIALVFAMGTTLANLEVGRPLFQFGEETLVKLSELLAPILELPSIPAVKLPSVSMKDFSISSYLPNYINPLSYTPNWTAAHATKTQ
jgi:hypothetical protein